MRTRASPLDNCLNYKFRKFYCKSTADVLPISGPEWWVEGWYDYHKSVRQWCKEEGII